MAGSRNTIPPPKKRPPSSPVGRFHEVLRRRGDDLLEHRVAVAVEDLRVLAQREVASLFPENTLEFLRVVRRFIGHLRGAGKVRHAQQPTQQQEFP